MTTPFTLENSLPLAKKFVEFVNKSKSPYFAVDTVKKTLLNNGFQHLSEKESWSLKPSGRYFFTRNHTSIVAFAIGAKYKSGNGFKIIGSHTDSPDLRLKPVSAVNSQGYLEIGVQTYGGGLWHTWFDRDLTVSGRVMVQEGDRIVQKLVEIDRPILRIPTLAIHLDRSVNTEGFKFSTETQLLPVLATTIQAQLTHPNKSQNKLDHHGLLLDMLAEKLKVDVQDIKDLELSVVDTQPSTVGGALNEFVFSPRLDNLLSCFCSLEALINSLPTLDQDKDVRVIAMFDNEEVGSESAPGAGSNLMDDTIRRINLLLSSQDTPVDSFSTTKSRSFLISADMAHAVHPNYPEKHQAQHRPEIHKGLVIKINANQRYATTTPSALLIKLLAEKSNSPLQKFVVRNDSLCGSTIGPMLSASTGIRTVDVGIPQLSMHSIREQCGVVDINSATKLFQVFFDEFTEMNEKLEVDN
ncbi:aspartyl aminopeptidase [Acrasis kona]|uniref:aspartyl aminopeptidase n=1 Tax=Acrasis kona TaxID=1008807 RepID=A0AAW2Z0U6_9EUKA